MHLLPSVALPPLQVGWMTGPAPLLAPIIKAHQFLVFTVSSSLQRAVAHGLDNEMGFYRWVGMLSVCQQQEQGGTSIK